MPLLPHVRPRLVLPGKPDDHYIRTLLFPQTLMLQVIMFAIRLPCGILN